MMRVSRWIRLAAMLLSAVVVVAGPPLVGLAGDEGAGLAEEPRPGEHTVTFKPVSMENPTVFGLRWGLQRTW